MPNYIGKYYIFINIMIWNFWRAIFFKGEAISSSIPSIIIFFQNIPKNDFFCQNSSQTSYIVSSPQLNFSVSTYFGSIGLFVLICLLSFIILDQRRAKKRKLSNKIVLTEANNLNENEEFIQQEPINSNSKEKIKINFLMWVSKLNFKFIV